MQLMSWTVARLGSRFSLLFEPYRRRVMHSALGRFLDKPMDLMVGLVEPGGVERAMPFSTRGTPFFNPEQFERLNSITFRGHSPEYRLRYEFNVHSVFYPQDEKLCILPAFYLEMRISPSGVVRWIPPKGPTPQTVKLFLRIDRPDTTITSSADANGAGRIDLSYRNTLTPQFDPMGEMCQKGFSPSLVTAADPDTPAREVDVRERILSLNSERCVPDPDGKGLTIELPVTEIGSGVKWRLVWGAFCGGDILEIADQRGPVPAGKASRPDPGTLYNPARFRYVKHWESLDEVMYQAVKTRDDHLALSRRLEKLAEQAPIRNAERHLLNQSFQCYLSNTFWCQIDRVSGVGSDAGAAALAALTSDGQPATERAETPGQLPQAAAQAITSATPANEEDPDAAREWFSVWEGSGFLHSTLDVEYTSAPFYLSLWPRLLSIQFHQWAKLVTTHKASNGAYLHHDLGRGTRLAGQMFPHDMPIEDNGDFLLLLQAYTRTTGDTAPAKQFADLIIPLARYLLWTDRDRSGFPTDGGPSSIVDGGPALYFARKQTYLAVKRIEALAAAADLLKIAGRGDDEVVDRCAKAVERDAPKVESSAWLGDHYAVCVDTSTDGLINPMSGNPVMEDAVPGADAYSIYTGQAMLLPLMCGRSGHLNPTHLLMDLMSAVREAMGPYGCGHSSAEADRVSIGQNVWRDVLARYMGVNSLSWTPNYWDLQVMSNTHQQSLGCCDSYIQNALCFYPRPIASMGLLLAYPRLVIDRLATGGAGITVDPDRHYPQRWPLFPLADWKAGKVPVCVVNLTGTVTIEGECDPITVRGASESAGMMH